MSLIRRFLVFLRVKFHDNEILYILIDKSNMLDNDGIGNNHLEC